MNVDLAKALYFRELDARVQQDARVGTYVTALSATGAAIWFLTGKSWPPITVLDTVALVLAALASVALVASLWFVLRASVGFEYKTSATANEILEFWGELKKFHEAHQSIAGTAEKEFEDFLIRKFCEAATNNAQIAKTRSERFHYAGRLLTGVVVGVVLSGTALAANIVMNTSATTRSRRMSDASNPPSPSPAPAPAASPTPAAPATPVASLPARPMEPQNIIVKGGAERGTKTIQMVIPTPRKP